jgi:uroporphyrinogen III methyltransferase / synthase
MLRTPGKVYLVGAGPGDPELLTLRGQELLSLADYVLYDGLVNPLVLRHTSATTERTARVDEEGQRVIHQAEINQRLIDAARSGKMVVRLKGGDPFIFGRGSEEALALKHAGIPFEVVPGITAAVACAEYAGLSLTHREHASAVAFITGHEDPVKSETSLDFEALARFPGTLVFYMGLHRLGGIVSRLIKHGKSADTPSILVSRGTTPFQLCVEAPLKELEDHVKQSFAVAPSLIIIGSAISQRQALNWFETKPLFGQTIGIPRSSDQVEPQIKRVLELGAHPVVMPLIEITTREVNHDIERTMSELARFQGIVFTSTNGVEAFFSHLAKRGLDSRALAGKVIACIGPSTSEKLLSYNIKSDLQPQEYRAEKLAEMIISSGNQGPWLWPRANRGRNVIIEMCQQSDISIDPVVFYDHHDQQALAPEALKLLEQGRLNWVALSSPAIATLFYQVLPEAYRIQLGQKVKIATISPITSKAALDAGLPVTCEATEYTWEGILQAIEHYSK